jgi:hypothetical protein
MADNAPYSAQRPPYPNLHVNLQGRIETYLITLTGTNGAVAVNTAASSGGVTATYVGEGNYAFTFPAGGTGAIGWVQILPPETAGETVAEVRSYAIDSDILNFATGAGRFVAVDASATPAVADVIGTVRLVVNVLKAPS